MIEHVIVMAAGTASSMHRLTLTRPQGMLPVLGTPLIAWVMDGYYRAGIRRFTVVVGERDGDVARFLHENWHSDITLRFVSQGHSHSLSSVLIANRNLFDEPFIIAPIDHLVSEQHVNTLCLYFDKHPGDSGAISIINQAQLNAGGNIILDPQGGVLFITEGPIAAHQGRLAWLPIFAYTPLFLHFLERVPIKPSSGERSVAAAIQMMIDAGHRMGTVPARWYMPLCTPEDLRLVNMDALNELSQPVILSRLPASVRVMPPAYIEQGVSVGRNAQIGPGAYIESGSTVGANSTVIASIVLGAYVAAGQKVSEQVVIEDQPGTS